MLHFRVSFFTKNFKKASEVIIACSGLENVWLVTNNLSLARHELKNAQKIWLC